MASPFIRVDFIKHIPVDYNGKDAIEPDGKGGTRVRRKVLHREVRIPQGGAARFFQSNVLWTEAALAEHRKDSQKSVHMVLALPKDPEVSDAQRIEMTRLFVQKYVVDPGLGAEIFIHVPGDYKPNSGEGNPHAHVLYTTRRVEEEGLSRKKARDLFPEVRSRKLVDGDPWMHWWVNFQNDYYEKNGLQVRVDPIGLISQEHTGPVRSLPPGSEVVARNEILIEANLAATTPANLLKNLTKNNATFDLKDLNRLLDKQLGKEPSAEKNKLRDEVFGRDKDKILGENKALVRYDRVTGKPSGRYTTQEVLAEERAAMRAANILRTRETGEVPADIANMASMGRKLEKEQVDGFDHTVEPGHLKIIVGRAGTGKSHLLGATRDAHVMQFNLLDKDKPKAEQRKVWGLSYTNQVVQDMKASGFENFATVSTMLYRLDKGEEGKPGGLKLAPGSVLIVDEVSMLSTPLLGKLLQHALKADVKLILAGDDRQLSSIERGGLLPELLRQQDEKVPPKLRRYVELTNVMRQKDDWQKKAARDLANYDFAKAIDAFEANKAIFWKEVDDKKAETKLVEAWKADSGKLIESIKPGQHSEPLLEHLPEEAQHAYRVGSAYRDMAVFAYTNEEVDKFNESLREVRRQRGELGVDVKLTVSYRQAQEGEEEEEEFHEVNFAIGDRIQFTKTDKELLVPIYNSQFATITAIDAKTGQIEALVDGGNAGPHFVCWNADEFDGVRHGYASTIHKAQGKSVKRTYVHHSQYWQAASSYVALTRQIEDVKIFVDFKRNTKRLSREMARTDVRSAAISWLSEKDVEAFNSATGFIPAEADMIRHDTLPIAMKQPNAPPVGTGGLAGMDLDHEAKPVGAQQVPPVAIKQENATGDGGFDGMDLDHEAKPAGAQQVPSVPIKQENATGDGGFDGMDLDHEAKPAGAQQVPSVAIKQENATGDGGFDGMDLDHEAKPAGAQQVPSVPIKQENTGDGGVADAEPYIKQEPRDEEWPGLEAGKARIREIAQQKQQVQWEAEVVHVIQVWDERVLNFELVGSKRPGEDAYRAAREALLAYGQFLAGRTAPGMPTNAQLLRSAGLALGLNKDSKLAHILDAPAPDHAVIEFVKQMENERQKTDDRSRKPHVQTRYDLRPRPRGRGR